MAPAVKPEPLSVLAWKLARAMSLDCEVVVELRSRPKRTVVGKVTHRRVDGRRLDPKTQKDQSTMIVTVNGEELHVERMASVGLRVRA